MNRILFALTLSATLVGPGQLAAKESLDLARITPVPNTEQIPIIDFFRPLLLQAPKLNPSGTHIAAIITAGDDRHQLLVYDLKTQATEMVGGSGDKDIYQVHWLNDRRLVFGLSTKKIYGLALMAANVGALKSGYPLLQYYGSRLVDVPSQSRLRPLVWNRFDGLDTYRDLGVAVINTDLATGKLVNLDDAKVDSGSFIAIRENNERHILDRYPVPESGICYGYLTDKAGQLEFALTALDGKLAMHQLIGRRWSDCAVDLEAIDIYGGGNQPGQLAVNGPRQNGKPRALQFMEGKTGALGEVLLQDKEYDFSGWLYRDAGTQEVVGAHYDRNGPQSVWFNENYRNLQTTLDGFFPGVATRILGSDDAAKIFLVTTFSDRQPDIYSWVNPTTRQAGLIKKSAPWIDPDRMQRVNIIKFKTRDGRQLDAYLTMPAGASKANPPPLVVVPHGGPWVRDRWGFDGEAQFLASRGYAVLKPNYRGSSGYDWMFPEGDQWDFRKMHDDVTDATKALIASKLIDGSRVAIMGGSFGGYLAISGVVNEPSLYRCAVTIAGVFDWAKLLQSEKFDQYNDASYGRRLLKLGNPKTEIEKFDLISPGRHVDRIRVPVFVSGGKDDYVVDIEQSKDLLSALEKYHVPHESLIVGEEGHGMHHLENELKLYSQIEAFFAKNLLPAKPPVAITTSSNP